MAPFLRSLTPTLGLTLLTLLSACQDKPEPVAAAPLPIIENQQLRFPAGHPQLALLPTQAGGPKRRQTSPQRPRRPTTSMMTTAMRV